VYVGAQVELSESEMGVSMETGVRGGYW
jgi:hypothetical protein